MTPEGNNPFNVLASLENTTALENLGEMGFHVLRGVRQSGGTFEDGFHILRAMYFAMINSETIEEEEDEETPTR